MLAGYILRLKIDQTIDKNYGYPGPWLPPKWGTHSFVSGSDKDTPQPFIIFLATVVYIS